MGRSGLSENDPYREMNTGEDEIRPDFLSGVRDWEAGEAYRLNGESYDKDGKKIKKRKSAGKVLGASEKAAAGESGGFSNNLSGMRERESSAPGIINSVKGKSGKDGGGKGKFGGKGKLKGKGFLKKGGPIVIIGGIFAVVAGVMAGAQNLMPIAIEEMIIEKFNSIGISSTMASDEWLDTQLNQGVRQGNPKSDEPDTMYAFSEYQVQQFKKQGITVVNGNGITALLYEKNGQYIPVVGSAALDSMSESEIISKIQSASGLSNIGKPISAKEALADADFKNPYTTASKSWRGGASGWFDNIMGGITEPKLGTSRNRWVKWATKSLKKARKEIKAEFDETAKAKSKSGDGGVESEELIKDGDGEDSETKTQEVEDVEMLDKDGNKIGDESVSDDKIKGDASREEIKKSLTGKALKAAAVATSIADAGCNILEGIMAIYTVASAYQNLQFLNLISGFLEAVDKVKAGDDNGSPIHSYGESLTTKANTLDDDGEVAKGHENKTAMESAGMAWLFGKAVVIMQSDPSVRNINFETIMSNMSTLFSDIGRLKDIYEKCGYVKMTSAAVNVVSTVISLIPGVGQGFKVFQVTLKAIGKAAVSFLVQQALNAIIPIATKNIAKLLIKDAATEWFGEDLGNAIASGANKYLGGNGTSGLQSPGSKSKLLAYTSARDTVIAEEAEYQRATRSPFDATSHYTFLGNLAYSIIPLAYSNGLLANLTSASSLVSSSVIAMLPTASAIDENSVLNSKGDCDLLESTGAVGDAFCNAYIITDVSSMGTSPVAVNEVVHKLGGDTEIASVESTVAGLGDNFNSDGSINKNSNLGKFITYCGQRTAQYGMKDANIAAQVSGSEGTVSKIIGVTPGLQDLQQIYDGFTDVKNLAWTNGSACVAADESYWNDEYRWYQRYSENQRLLENMNPGYTSEVTAFMNDYYGENPLDQSFEGTLARFSGMTKEKVEDTLALMDYYEFLEDYNPSERYAFGKPVVEEGKELRFDNENSVAENVWIVLLNQISYADVRNRSFAV